MALIVNLFGGPGTGKSTTAAAVFSLLKLHGVNCELVTEYAKDLVWEERTKTFENENYLLAKQEHKLWRVQNFVDVVITDSPILLSVVYGDNSNIFIEHILELHGKYRNMNVLLKRVKEYNPVGRNQNEDEAKEIDEKIREMLNNYVLYSGADATFAGANAITNQILKRLNMKLSYKITEF